MQVKPQLLMCARHWRMVPRDIQQRVYATYRVGQCEDKRPSKEWHDAAGAAIAYVALKEGKPVMKRDVRRLVMVGGYDAWIVTAMVTKHGEGKREVVLGLIEEIKRGINAAP